MKRPLNLSFSTMLTGSSPWRLHLAQNLGLILTSLFFLPLSSFLLLLSYISSTFLSNEASTRRRIRRSPTFRPKTILVTGVGMTKGLTLARTFYLAGHNVVGADFQTYGIPVSGRFSRALRKFYALPKPNESDGAAFYINALLRIVQRENVDLWVSCSGVASAVEDGQAAEVLERRSDCKSIQFDVATTQTLHEKHSFIEQTRSLGLPVPETHNVTSRAAVHRVLHESPRTKKRYIMKSVGMDDATRGNMTVLPRRTLSETYNHLSTIPISDSQPWVLQQYIPGREYCTHALIIDNTVRAFVACPSLELLMHYEALHPDLPLSKAMLRFTQEFATRYPGKLTGHMSFDFLIEERVSEKGAEMGLVPIECNPRAHTAVVLFQGREKEMAEVYLRPCESSMNGHAEVTNGLAEVMNGHTEASRQAPDPVTPILQPAKYYWIGHDLVTLVLYPLLLVLLRKMALQEFEKDCYKFSQHLLLCKDGTYELWDPLPFWWLYHVYWPGQFLACILQQKKWSRINVSTVKMFGC